ncbi:unnamed protein product, partial [Citrullus colocynthis]
WNFISMEEMSRILLGVVYGIALMARWQHMMRHRSTKRLMQGKKQSRRILLAFYQILMAH